MLNPILYQQLSNKLYYSKVRVCGGIHKIIHLLFNCDLPARAKIGKGTTLGHGGIGVVINSKAVIGEDCVIAQNVIIAGKDGGATNIGNNVYIGANSVIMGKITIGDTCFIGALSLVNKSFPSNCVIAGIPAKILKYRTVDNVIYGYKQLEIN